jgi:hypothetical protein
MCRPCQGNTPRLARTKLARFPATGPACEKVFYSHCQIQLLIGNNLQDCPLECAISVPDYLYERDVCKGPVRSRE